MNESMRLAIGGLSLDRGELDDAIRRSRQEFGPVFEATFPVVLRYMLARVGNRAVAEDLTADVFEQAVRGWDRFEGRSTPLTWLLGIARHVLSHQHRRATPELVPLDTAPPERLHDSHDGPEVEAERRAETFVLHRALTGLSEADRELLALRFGADLSHREIAEVLGAREVAVRVRLHRAIGRLGRTLAHLEGTT